MSANCYFHFTLGPVQGFVSQARRTRDFWAGSFLLAWLTARAMKAVQDAGGAIILPSVANDDLFARVNESSGEGPKVGLLPNNFTAEIPEGFDGKVAEQAVQKAWKALADAVWEKDKLEEAGVSRELWDEQIGCFWDMAWVIADTDDAKALAMRKNWRTYMPPESRGDKCTMMGEWQELSGADKPRPQQQKQFWRKLKEVAGISDIELRENERLCAIAYVKRRFVHTWQRLDGHQGWKLPTSVPSTSYMAAVHWLEQAVEYGDEAQLKAFHDAAKKAVPDYGEWSTKSTKIKCIDDKVGKKGLAFRFTSLDGRVFFKAALENSKEFAPEKARPVLDALDKLTQTKISNGRKLGHPSPFYAILMMDGDSLGETKKALTDAGRSAIALSEALAVFTKSVPAIVEKYNGFLIYAGGDDVLALLPLEDALDCAKACRDAYFKAFEGKLHADKKATISAAIEYAHMKLPLTMILKDAHNLLDDVAKDQAGRDAVACRIWKPGGLQQTWAMPWDHAIEDGEPAMARLAKKLGKDEQGEPGYAGKLLYHIRETLEMLQGASDIAHEDMVKLLVADYVSSGLLDGVSDKEGRAEALIRPLLRQCRVFENRTDTGKLSADGALLMRFLAQKGVER